MNDLKNLEPYKDNFNVYNLITFIDKSYRLFFDKKEKCFLIINTAKNYQICLKFNNFSLNILNKLQFTRIENSAKLFNFIDNYNAKLEDKNINNSKQILSDSISNLINYSKRTTSISKSDIFKIIKGNND